MMGGVIPTVDDLLAAPVGVALLDRIAPSASVWVKADRLHTLGASVQQTGVVLSTSSVGLSSASSAC